MASEQPPEDPQRAHQVSDAGTVRHLLGQLEEVLLRSEHQIASEVGARVAPAWQRATQGEARWQVSMGVVAALAMQVTLPKEVIFRPRWLLPSLAGLLLLGLLAANPARIDRRSPALRVASLMLIATVSLANASSAGRLITHLVRGTGAMPPTCCSPAVPSG